MTRKLLTFQLSTEGDQIEIHVDTKGLDELLFLLNELRNRGRQDHEHLMTESWGGSELTEELVGPEGHLINSVTVYFWPGAPGGGTEQEPSRGE